jgi:glycine cleavage system transcriptional repressor
MRVAVTAVGPDRPGIVAAVTGVLMGHGANLEDTSMTILRGQFAMMLVVEVPGGEGAEALEDALNREAGDLGLTISVRPLDASAAGAGGAGSTWAVSVYGADRPGIVHRVARLLADHGGNIADLTTRIVGEDDHPSYVMLLEVTLPSEEAADRLAAALESLAEELGIEVHLRPDDADVL